MEKEFNSIYLGIVVQNNDPQKRGRVKVFVPHISPTVYQNWIGDDKDKYFKSIDGHLQPIMDKLKIILPWAEVSCPLTSENTSKRYNNYSNIATVSDTNTFVNLSANSSASTGEIYDQSSFRLNDAFSDNSNNVNNINPYSFSYKPNTYSNKAKGSFGIPSVGAHVYVFFRDGNSQFPVLIGTSFGKDDWQGIYDNEVDYPGKFENYDQSSTEEDYNVTTYRNKYVLNQKGGTLEINNTDHNEKIKLTHYSGSFKEFNNNTNSELATKNNQKLVLNDEYNTIKGFKNEFTGKNYDEIVLRDKYKKIGNLNVSVFEEWKKKYATVQDKKQLFDIKRTQNNNVKSNGDIILRVNSKQQKRSGKFADFPVTKTNKYLAVNNLNTFESTPYPALNISGFEQGGQSPVFDNNLKVMQTSQTLQKNGAALNLGTTKENWPSESGKGFTNGEGKSPSTQDGSWDKEDKNLSTFILNIQSDLMSQERDFGLGGSEIIEISKNKLENIGTVMNDYGSIRLDPIGKLLSNEVLVGSETTYVNSDSGPLLEYVDVQDLPGGTYNLNVNNRYNVMVGAGGINLKSYGPTNISGSITNVAGQQVNIGSENEVNIDGKVINISAEILRLRNKRQRQVLIDSSLGVKNNVVIGGGLSVEGETYLQHVTAPSETQVTNTTQTLGQTVQNAIIGYVNYYWTDPGGAATVPVYGGTMGGVPQPDTITTYPHTHTFENLPLTLTDSNESTRNSAKTQGINGESRVIAAPQFNTLKSGITVDSLSGQGGVGQTDSSGTLSVTSSAGNVNFHS